jgi:hypothetical protein
VIGFVGFLQQIVPHNLLFTWEKGSFSELIVTGPDFTFYDTLNTTGNLILPDLLNEGSGSGSGFVHATYASQITDYGVFFKRYYSESSNPHNLAESYYLATKALSWMNIIIGDPKTTITTEGGSSIDNLEYFDELTIFPNPATDQINIRFRAKTAGEITLSVVDQLGKTIKTGTFFVKNGQNEFDFKTDDLHSGLWFIGLKGLSGISEYKKIIIRK